MEKWLPDLVCSGSPTMFVRECRAPVGFAASHKVSQVTLAASTPAEPHQANMEMWMLDAPQAFGSQWQPNKTVQPAQSEPWCSRLSQTLRMLTKRCIWSKTISSRTSCIYLQSRPITLTKYSIKLACLNLRTSPQHPPGHWSCWTRSSTCLHVDKTHTLTQPRHSGLSSQPPLPLKISH